MEADGPRCQVSGHHVKKAQLASARQAVWQAVAFGVVPCLLPPE